MGVEQLAIPAGVVADGAGQAIHLAEGLFAQALAHLSILAIPGMGHFNAQSIDAADEGLGLFHAVLESLVADEPDRAHQAAGGIAQQHPVRGVVLCGPSAGSLCWFEQALSAFHGAPRPVRGLGLLPYSNCVHYDAEPARRAEYHRAVADGMCGGFAAGDGVALHFHGNRLERAVSSRSDGSAYRVALEGRKVVESRLE